jgi:hypothetical protein
MESPGSVTSLVAAKLPSGDDRIDALSVRIAGNFMPPVDPNSPLTPDQAEKAKRWLAGYLNGNDALFEKDVLAETISKDEYQALIATRNLLIRLFGRLNRAFGEDPEIPATIENERERFALALWSIAVFFGKSGFNLPFADRFLELGSAISDLNNGSRPELLWPAKIDSNPPLESQFWRARVNVVLAFEALSRGAQRRSGSQHRLCIAQKIDQDIPELERLLRPKMQDLTPGSRNLPKTIIDDWQKKLKGSGIKNGEAIKLYEFGREVLETLPEDSLAEFAQERLNSAKAFCATLSPSS